MALADAAHAVTTQVTGPRMLNRIDATPAASLGMIMVTARGTDPACARLIITLIWFVERQHPAQTEPTTTPARSASSASPT